MMIRDVSFDRGYLVFTLEVTEIRVPLDQFPRLQNARSLEERLNWQLIGDGIGVHWPALDEDISLAGVLAYASGYCEHESISKVEDAYLRGKSDGAAVRHLFVYGTLRSGVDNEAARLLSAHAELVAEGSVCGRLYDLGEYPGLVLSKFGEVRGDLYDLGHANRKELLEQLDRYEGCSSDNPQPHEYRRELVDVELLSGRRLRAWTYLLNRATDGLPTWDGLKLRVSGRNLERLLDAAEREVRLAPEARQEVRKTTAEEFRDRQAAAADYLLGAARALLASDEDPHALSNCKKHDGDETKPCHKWKMLRSAVKRYESAAEAYRIYVRR